MPVFVSLHTFEDMQTIIGILYLGRKKTRMVCSKKLGWW